MLLSSDWKFRISIQNRSIFLVILLQEHFSKQIHLHHYDRDTSLIFNFIIIQTFFGVRCIGTFSLLFLNAISCILRQTDPYILHPFNIEIFFMISMGIALLFSFFRVVMIIALFYNSFFMSLSEGFFVFVVWIGRFFLQSTEPTKPFDLGPGSRFAFPFEKLLFSYSSSLCSFLFHCFYRHRNF